MTTADGLDEVAPVSQTDLDDQGIGIVKPVSTFVAIEDNRACWTDCGGHASCFVYSCWLRSLYLFMLYRSAVSS